MGLIKCGECGREISDQAQECPGCGAPVRAGKDIKLMANLGGFRGCLIIGIVIILIICYFIAKGTFD